MLLMELPPCAFSRRARINRWVDPGFGVIFRDDLLLELRNSVDPDEVHSTPAEPSAGHASAVDPFELPRKINHDIEFPTGHPIVAVQAVMGEVHQLSETYEIGAL